MPDSQHATHDLELVAAFAAGDAGGTDLERATSLVASCPDCAALHHDLRSIATAMPSLPAPVRPRDFRLTPDQAASLRPTGIRGLIAAFASPRLSFATPLGSGLAALGIIGILVASGGLPMGGATSGGAAAGDPVVYGSPAAANETATVAPVLDAATGSGSSAAPAGGAPASAMPEAPVDITGGGGAPAVGGEPTPVVEAQPYAYAPASPMAGEERNAVEAPAEAKRSADQSLLILGGVMLLVGLALVALRWTSRRLA